MENNGLSDNGGGRARILIVGAGFAGFACARELEKRLGPGRRPLRRVRRGRLRRRPRPHATRRDHATHSPARREAGQDGGSQHRRLARTWMAGAIQAQ